MVLPLQTSSKARRPPVKQVCRMGLLGIKTVGYQLSSQGGRGDLPWDPSHFFFKSDQVGP